MKRFFVIIICLISAANVFGQQSYKYISADSYLLRPYVKELVGVDYVPINWVGSRSFRVPMLGDKLISIDEKYMDFFKKDFYITMPETSRVQEQKTEAGIGMAEKYAAMDASRVFDAQAHLTSDVKHILDAEEGAYIPDKPVPFSVYGYTNGLYVGYLLGKRAALSARDIAFIEPEDKSYLVSRGDSGLDARRIAAQERAERLKTQYEAQVKLYNDSLKQDAKDLLQYIRKNKILVFESSKDSEYGYYTFRLKVFNCFTKPIKRLDFVAIALDSDGDPRWYDENRTVKKIWFNDTIGVLESKDIYWYNLYYDGSYDIRYITLLGVSVTFSDNSTMHFETQEKVDKTKLWNHDIKITDDFYKYIK